MTFNKSEQADEYVWKLLKKMCSNEAGLDKFSGNTLTSLNLQGVEISESIIGGILKLIVDHHTLAELKLTLKLSQHNLSIVNNDENRYRLSGSYEFHLE